MATVTTTIDSGGGGDYTDPALWENDLDNGAVYSSGDDAVGECEGDTFLLTSELQINGGGTVGLNSRKLTAPTGERHDGTDTTGAKVERTSGTGNVIGYSITRTTVEWLIVTESSSNNMSIAISSSGGNDHLYTLNNILCHMSRNGSGNCRCISSSGSGTTASFTNNICYDVDQGQTGDAYGIQYGPGGPSGANGDNACMNNTIFDIKGTDGNAHGLRMDRGDADCKAENNIACDTTCSGTGTAADITWVGFNPDTDYNMSSDATADDDSSANSIINVTTADQFVSIVGGSVDLHLKSGSDAIDAGNDRGTDPLGVEIDIDGRDRDAEGDTWDIGAHEFVSVAAGARLAERRQATNREFIEY